MWVDRKQLFIKQCGRGREFGPEALTGYQQLKSLYLPGSTG
jgi:hypothetical protein